MKIMRWFCRINYFSNFFIEISLPSKK